MDTAKPFLVIAAVGVGLVAALHLALSARAAELLGSPRAANAVFWSVGALTAIVIMLAGGDGGALRRLGAVPAGLWTAGAMGASIVLAISVIIPRLGTGPTMVALLLGQVLLGAVLSHYGLFGSPTVQLTAVRWLGAALMGAGVWLVVR